MTANWLKIIDRLDLRESIGRQFENILYEDQGLAHGKVLHQAIALCVSEGVS